MGVVRQWLLLSIAKKPTVRLPLMVCCSAHGGGGHVAGLCTSSAGMVVLPLTAPEGRGLVLGLSMSTSQTGADAERHPSRLARRSVCCAMSILYRVYRCVLIEWRVFGRRSPMVRLHPALASQLGGFGSPRYWRRVAIVRCVVRGSVHREHTRRPRACRIYRISGDGTPPSC